MKLDFNTSVKEMTEKHPEVKKAVNDYMESDYPKYIKELLFAYLEKATPEQRDKFFELTKK